MNRDTSSDIVWATFLDAQLSVLMRIILGPLLARAQGVSACFFMFDVRRGFRDWKQMGKSCTVSGSLLLVVAYTPRLVEVALCCLFGWDVEHCLEHALTLRVRALPEGLGAALHIFLAMDLPR